MRYVVRMKKKLKIRIFSCLAVTCDRVGFMGVFVWFLQKIDEQEDAQNVEAPVRKVKEDREKERPFSVETKYKGYEDLLDVDEDDPDVIVPKDLQGSVRALNYALAHPLIFSEPHGTYKEKRVKKPQVSVRLSNNTLIDTPMSVFDSQYSKLDTWEYRLSLIESRETMFHFLLHNRYLMLTSIGNHARIKVPI